jgi:glyoxylase-like metal-dependent hydrolase (beta-lactamase superfamily II)
LSAVVRGLRIALLCAPRSALMLVLGLASCAAPAPPTAEAQTPAVPRASAPTLVPVRASERVCYVQGEAGLATRTNRGFNSNAAFVVTDDGVVVFDALGTPALGAALKQAIASVTAQPIRRVIVSHFHADHFYGLQALGGPGVEVWAHEKGRATLASEFTASRLEQRRRDLAPYVDANTRLIGADRWVSFDARGELAFALGGVKFRLIDVSGAHSDEDLMLFVDNDRVLLAGDLYFSGRVPFVGNADSKRWIEAMERIVPLVPLMVIPGHGAAGRDPLPDIAFTREYLQFLRDTMGQAVRDLKSFDEAYAATDWSRYAKVPAFDAANRINAYGTYLRMEQESLRK